jgi:hypothetical protein
MTQPLGTTGNGATGAAGAVPGAVGIRRVLASQGFGRGGTWGPRLIGAFAVSQIAAGVFVPDPANGFPPGTPAGPAQHPTWHSGLHFTLASLGFLALIVACLLVARGFAARRLSGWAAYSAGTGVLLLVGTAAESARANHGPVNLIFFVTAVWAFAWISVLAGSLRAQSPERKAELP